MSGSRRVLMTQMSSSLLATLLGPLSTAEGTGVSSPIVSPSCGDAAANGWQQHNAAITTRKDWNRAKSRKSDTAHKKASPSRDAAA